MNKLYNVWYQCWYVFYYSVGDYRMLLDIKTGELSYTEEKQDLAVFRKTAAITIISLIGLNLLFKLIPQKMPLLFGGIGIGLAVLGLLSLLFIRFKGDGGESNPWTLIENQETYLIIVNNSLGLSRMTGKSAPLKMLFCEIFFIAMAIYFYYIPANYMNSSSHGFLRWWSWNLLWSLLVSFVFASLVVANPIKLIRAQWLLYNKFEKR